jgi:hypothetical protein
MVSLDEHIVAEKLPAPAGIIMDIEGAEYLALAGAPQAIAETRFLYIEYVPHALQNVGGVANADFFARLIPHFDEVRFMRTRPGSFSLKTEPEHFLRVADEYRREGRSDDLLFVKK